MSEAVSKLLEALETFGPAKLSTEFWKQIQEKPEALEDLKDLASRLNASFKQKVALAP